ncbi:MAG: hypothetical protein WC069_02885 [Candidatus Shapirobacteria bacterium]
MDMPRWGDILVMKDLEYPNTQRYSFVYSANTDSIVAWQLGVVENQRATNAAETPLERFRILDMQTEFMTIVLTNDPQMHLRAEVTTQQEAPLEFAKTIRWLKDNR